MIKKIYLSQLNLDKSIENLYGLLLSFPEVDEIKVDFDNNCIIIELNTMISDETLKHSIKSLGKFDITNII